MLFKRLPFLLVISGPSGSGKSTLIRYLFQEVEGLTLSVSHTTRQPRANEVNGIAYHFISDAQFQLKAAAGDFLEYAQVHGFFYGTAATSVGTCLQRGNDVVLDVDVQGMRSIVSSGSFDMVTVFILPPDRDELVRRLTARGADSSAVIEKRLQNAAYEISQAPFYDYNIVNQDLMSASTALKSIVLAERQRARRFMFAQ